MGNAVSLPGVERHGTTVEPIVGMNWHCFSVVVT
jgi:hypothetical protein